MKTFTVTTLSRYFNTFEITSPTPASNNVASKDMIFNWVDMSEEEYELNLKLVMVRYLHLLKMMLKS